LALVFTIASQDRYEACLLLTRAMVR